MAEAASGVAVVFKCFVLFQSQSHSAAVNIGLLSIFVGTLRGFATCGNKQSLLAFTI